MLGQIFLNGVVENWNRRQYTWDDASAVDMGGGRPLGGFVTMNAAERPFLIVGGTLVKPNGTDYPRLVPVEYTPLYTGVRQQFGQIGGTYLSPWAYDRLVVAGRSSTARARWTRTQRASVHAGRRHRQQRRGAAAHADAG